MELSEIAFNIAHLGGCLIWSFGNYSKQYAVGLLGAFSTAAISFFAERPVLAIGLSVIMAAGTIYLWWKGGGGDKTKKAARELGAKSKARVQALVDQMAPQPARSPA